MTVGALLDLGVDAAALATELSKLGLDAEFHTHIASAARQMITGTKFDVHVMASADTHSHSHSHNHEQGHGHSHTHPHSDTHTHGRSYREIRELIAASGLSDFVRERSISVFHRIAVAEGKIHGCPPEDVGFHEVGAIDSIVDIVGACICLDLLGRPEVYCSNLFDGTGTIDCAHGKFPIPAPATLEILRGIPFRQIDEEMEFITPTGAALAAEFAREFGPMPLMRVSRTGYGLGTRDTCPRPNVLRALLGELVTDDQTSDVVVQIETNIDDTTPEVAATFPAALLAEGALEAFLTPVQMKKNRPGFQLTVLCEVDLEQRLTRWILTHTSAFGVRMHKCRRQKLAREIVSVQTAYGEISVKLGHLAGQCVQASPEFESYSNAAAAHGVPVQEAYLEALRAAATFKQ